MTMHERCCVQLTLYMHFYFHFIHLCSLLCYLAIMAFHTLCVPIIQVIDWAERAEHKLSMELVPIRSNV